MTPRNERAAASELFTQEPRFGKAWGEAGQPAPPTSGENRCAGPAPSDSARPRPPPARAAPPSVRHRAGSQGPQEFIGGYFGRAP